MKNWNKMILKPLPTESHSVLQNNRPKKPQEHKEMQIKLKPLLQEGLGMNCGFFLGLFWLELSG